MGRLFGTDGARGIANSELTCELAIQIGRATAMLTPFMPCGAKLPVISLFAGVFFSDSIWVGPLMYFVGLIIIFLCALLINVLTGNKNKKSYFIIWDRDDLTTENYKRYLFNVSNASNIIKHSITGNGYYFEDKNLILNDEIEIDYLASWHYLKFYDEYKNLDIPMIDTSDKAAAFIKNALKIRVTTDMLIGCVSQVSLNHIGVLIVDEIQNVVNSKNGKSTINIVCNGVKKMTSLIAPIAKSMREYSELLFIRVNSNREISILS